MSKTRSTAERQRALDGIRGVASLAVMLWHCYLVAAPNLSTRWPDPGWWLAYSPLRVLFDGADAVLVFFVLSGLVVALPALRHGFSWLAYYPRRLVRLYLPVIVSVLLAAAYIVLVPRRWSVPATDWLGTGSTAQVVTGKQLLLELSLVTERPFLNNPLWSLHWEVVFSLLLPLYVLIAVKTRRIWPVMLGVSIALAVVGAWTAADWSGGVWLKYLPVFFIGTVMAANLDGVFGVARRISAARRGTVWWVLILVGAAALIAAGPVFDGMGLGSGQPAAGVRTLTVLACAALVFAGIGCVPLRRVLETRLVQWFGRMSFSLYLVHVPLLVTLVALFGMRNWLLAIVLEIPSALLLAWVFTRWVEAPSHRLSKLAGAVVAAGFASRRRTVASPSQVANAPGRSSGVEPVRFGAPGDHRAGGDDASAGHLDATEHDRAGS